MQNAIKKKRLPDTTPMNLTYSVKMNYMTQYFWHISVSVSLTVVTIIFTAELPVVERFYGNRRYFNSCKK